MKPGAGDDPFAEDDGADGEESNASDSPEEGDSTASNLLNEPTAAADQTVATQEHVSELPYKYRRSSVKEGRTQQPMFLQDSTAELIDETVDAVEAAFDEDVYKTDVVEAMIVAGGENTTPETVLRRWGYGMKNR